MSWKVHSRGVHTSGTFVVLPILLILELNKYS
jgi:hypothetical protein